MCDIWVIFKTSVKSHTNKFPTNFTFRHPLPPVTANFTRPAAPARRRLSACRHTLNFPHSGESPPPSSSHTLLPLRAIRVLISFFFRLRNTVVKPITRAVGEIALPPPPIFQISKVLFVLYFVSFGYLLFTPVKRIKNSFLWDRFGNIFFKLKIGKWKFSILITNCLLFVFASKHTDLEFFQYQGFHAEVNICLSVILACQ